MSEILEKTPKMQIPVKNGLVRGVLSDDLGSGGILVPLKSVHFLINP